MSDFKCEETGPWVTSKAMCLACFYEWVAVYPLGLGFYLECPSCGLQEGVPEDDADDD